MFTSNVYSGVVSAISVSSLFLHSMALVSVSGVSPVYQTTKSSHRVLYIKEFFLIFDFVH